MKRVVKGEENLSRFFYGYVKPWVGAPLYKSLFVVDIKYVEFYPYRKLVVKTNYLNGFLRFF